MNRFVLAAAAAILTVSCLPADATTIRDGFNGITLHRNDDASSERQALGFNVNFFGQTYSSVFVNNNGNLTFNAPLAEFTPFSLTNTFEPIIAPFFADVDTRSIGDPVRFGGGAVNGHRAFGASYLNVGYFADGQSLNSFQVVLIERGDTGLGNFDIEFNYRDINWETGDASGGVDGLGGNSAIAGFSNGTGLPDTFLEIPGSNIDGALLNGAPNSLIQWSNVGVPGRFVFQARSGDINTVPVLPAEVPLPATAGMMALGLAGLTALRRRKTAKS